MPVRPANLDGVPGLPIDAQDTRHGVTLWARAIAQSSDMTAVELEAYLDPPDAADAAERRSLRGIGCSLGGGRLCGDRLFLRDEDDNAYYEHGFGAMDQGGKGHREVVTFPRLPDRVRTVVLESEFMWIHHWSEERVRVPLPSESDVTMAGYTGRVKVTRLPGVYTEGAVRVEFHRRPGGRRAARLIASVNTEVARPGGMHTARQASDRRSSRADGRRPTSSCAGLSCSCGPGGYGSRCRRSERLLSAGLLPRQLSDDRPEALDVWPAQAEVRDPDRVPHAHDVIADLP